MKFIRPGLFLIASSIASMQGNADTVDASAVTTFESGTVLQSSQVNTTLNALISAINNNATRISAIEDAASTPLDIAGRQYCIKEIETGFAVSNTPFTDPNIGQRRGFFSGGIVFSSGGTATVTPYQDDFKEAFPGSAVIDDSDPLDTFDVTWTLTGNVLVLDFGDGDGDQFILVNSGEVIIGGHASAEPNGSGTGVFYASNLVIAVEVGDASTCAGAL